MSMLENHELLQIGTLISKGDKSIEKEIKKCLSDMDAYYEEHEEDYEDRCLDRETIEEEEVEEEELQWIALVDILINHAYCCELDWKCYKEDFVYCLNELHGMEFYNLTLEEDWLDEEADVTEWCTVIDEKWQEKGVCVAALDIDSDSYVIFPIMKKELEKLMELADEIDCRIALAKDM